MYTYATESQQESAKAETACRARVIYAPEPDDLLFFFLRNA